jgi:hypothetical protein
MEGSSSPELSYTWVHKGGASRRALGCSRCSAPLGAEAWMLLLRRAAGLVVPSWQHMAKVTLRAVRDLCGEGVVW